MGMVAKSAEPRTLVNRKGYKLVVTNSDKDAFDKLECAVNQGHGGDFAADLIRKGARHGLSEEQFWWVHKLLHDIEHPPAPIVFGNIAHAYARARDNGVRTKDMKMLVGAATMDGDDFAIQLSMATGRSRYPGNVWVTLPGIDLYCGRIDTDGVFYKVNKCPEQVVDVLHNVDGGDAGSVLPW